MMSLRDFFFYFNSDSHFDSQDRGSPKDQLCPIIFNPSQQMSFLGMIGDTGTPLVVMLLTDQVDLNYLIVMTILQNIFSVNNLYCLVFLLG